MKAIKRPTPITVEVFYPESKPWPRNVKESKTNPGEYFVYNKLHDSPIKLERGDFVNVTEPNDTYPIAKKVFKATYDVVK
jgi:hypothetical protein